MDEPIGPIQIPLTDEQQQLIHRLSGQFAQVLELVPEPSDAKAGSGRALQFTWRLSVATGIPRRQWVPADDRRDPPPGSDATG